MKPIGTFLALLGLTMLGSHVFVSKPFYNPYFPNIDQETGAWFEMTLAIIGITLSSIPEDIILSLSSVVSELRDIEDKLDAIKDCAKHNLQDFVSKDFVAEHRGY